jgi:uncharacterized membrane protein YphA (DoxX/SURF4 family)
MTLAVLLARLVLSVTFIAAGGGKLSSREATRTAVADFGVAQRLVRPASVALPLTEVALGGLLLFAPTGRWAAGAAGVLLALLSVAVARSVRAGKRPECNCFGKLGGSTVGPQTLLRNFVLLALSVFGTGRAETISHLLASTSTLRATAYVVVTVLVAGQAWLVRQLARQNRTLLRQVGALKADQHVGHHADHGTGHHWGGRLPGLPVGVPAPDFELAEPGAGRWSRDDLLVAGAARGARNLALVFVKPGCEACDHLVRRMAGARPSADRAIVLLAFAGAVELAASLANSGTEITVLEGDDRVAAAFGVIGAPSAVLIDLEGRVTSDLVTGEDAVADLLYRIPSAVHTAAA